MQVTGLKELITAFENFDRGFRDVLVPQLLFRVAQQKRDALYQDVRGRYRIITGLLLNSIKATRVKEGAKNTGALVHIGGNARPSNPAASNRHYRYPFYAAILEHRDHYFLPAIARGESAQLDAAIDAVRDDFEALIRKIQRGGRLSISEISAFLPEE